MIKTRINNEYKDVVKIFGGGTLQKEIVKVWSREAQEYVYESSVEYTGTLPITINANGDALIDYRICGADGGVGEPTENLFDTAKETKGAFIDVAGRINSNSTAAYSDLIAVEQMTYYVCASSKYYDLGSWTLRVHGYDENGNWVKQIAETTSFTQEGYHSLAITIDDTEIKKIRISYFYAWVNWLTFSEQAMSSYIPYGYKLPMTVSDGNTVQNVPLYIGENQLDSVEGVADYVDKSSGKIVRIIREYTFTGDEPFGAYGVGFYWYMAFRDANTTSDIITIRISHFTARPNCTISVLIRETFGDNCACFRANTSDLMLRSTTNFTTAEECKAYFKNQYDNGTPVKMWYIMKTPVEEAPPIPLPEITTIKGETIIDYDGEPKPSQMYVKYRR